MFQVLGREPYLAMDKLDIDIKQIIVNSKKKKML